MKRPLPRALNSEGQTPVKIASVIRYHLGELSARNAHHEFEHLCRYLAKARIHSNILPATGPVSSGGDQGRDFETFRSQVAYPAVSNFKDMVSDAKVVFGSSLDKRIERKIRTDVGSIATRGGSVERIIYFCESNLAVAKRHKLKAWARESHNVSLEIFDGTAIADLLSDRDVFWIAQEFLHIPAEIMPTTADRDGWYGRQVERWADRSPMVVSNADFAEVKFGLRRATFHNDARPHLLFWIGLMKPFLKESAPRQLQRCADYELAVAHLRGKGDLASEFGLVRDYFADVEDWLAVADLQDAATLLVYAFGGLMLGQCDVEPAMLFKWRQRVMSVLGREIARAPGPGRRSGLLSVRAFLQSMPESVGSPIPYERCFDDWEAALGEAEKTPLFPIEELVRDLSKMTPALGESPRFVALADRADGLFASRQGPVAAAEHMYVRAITFYEADRLLDAIRDLHRVQFRWLTGDTMVRFQRASFILAKSYLELGLAYASKHVALAASFSALHSDDPAVIHSLPTVMFAAADADNAAGNSLSYFNLLLIGLEAHARLDPDPLQPDKHPQVDAQLGQATALRGLAAREGGTQLAAVDKLLSEVPFPLRDPIVRASVDPSGFWLKGSWDDVWDGIEEHFLDRPFADLGTVRSTRWRAFGIRWSAVFDNDRQTNGIAEEFLACLQITLAALAGTDLCLLPIEIRLELSVSRAARRAKILHKKPSSATGSVIAIRLARRDAESPHDHTGETLAIIAEVLGQISMLPVGELLETLKEPLLTAANRIHIGRPYRELYDEFLPDERFAKTERHASSPVQPDRPHRGWQHPLLAPKDGPGPTYDPSDALTYVRARYDRGLRLAGLSIRGLMADEDRRARLRGWHEEGLKDWEILSIVLNAAVNIRHPLADDAELSPEDLDRFRRAFESKEAETTAIAASAFTDELLVTSRRLFEVAYLRAWGLDIPFPDLDEKMIETFLVDRYGLRTDDVEHPDIFGWPSQPN
ncbi:hypothetical protein [Bradyrhizobium sp. LA6.7]|uniref:hypothetical protein n=1 Tax=unclassified Bradyrhizobium TaxID=2631580 RepID=UPI00339210E6